MTRVLGIDPGLRITGYGCVEGDGDRPVLVEAGVFRLARSSPPPPLPQRLVELERDLSDLLDRVRPALVAVESLFVHAHHVGTATLMGHARGVVLLAAARRGIPLREIAPAELKRATSLAGAARKYQIRSVVCDRLGLRPAAGPDDVYDALALAMCAASRAQGEAARAAVARAGAPLAAR